MSHHESDHLSGPAATVHIVTMPVPSTFGPPPDLPPFLRPFWPKPGPENWLARAFLIAPDGKELAATYAVLATTEEAARDGALAAAREAHRLRLAPHHR